MTRYRFLQESIKIAAFSLLIFWIKAAATNIHYGQVDFSGKWVLNLNKSQFGNIPSTAAVKQFEVQQTKDSILIRKITFNSDGIQETTTESISLDGHASAQLLINKRTRFSSAGWSPNKDTLYIANNYSFPNDPQKVEYSLSQWWGMMNSGNELLVILKSPSYVIRAVYDKQ